MLTPRLTNCTDCSSISVLLQKIDCKLAELSGNLYNNISYMLNLSVNKETLFQLITYKRILTYKYNNPYYLCSYPLDKITSKVLRLTSGCVNKCNDSYSTAYITTTSTTTMPVTTTTTTTINPLAGDFNINVGSSLSNKVNSVSPNFYNINLGSFPAGVGDTFEGKVLSGGTSITINYDSPDLLPELRVVKNNIIVADDLGIPQGSNLNYTYTISWLETDDIRITLNNLP